MKGLLRYHSTVKSFAALEDYTAIAAPGAGKRLVITFVTGCSRTSYHDRALRIQDADKNIVCGMVMGELGAGEQCGVMPDEDPICLPENKALICSGPAGTGNSYKWSVHYYIDTL